MALHDHFREYTKEEILDIKRKVCIAHNCPYLARMSDYQSSTTSNNFCSYIQWTGHMRGCMPDECTHYTDDKSQIKKPKFNLDDGYNKF